MPKGIDIQEIGFEKRNSTHLPMTIPVTLPITFFIHIKRSIFNQVSLISNNI